MKKYFVYKVAALMLCTALLTGCGQKSEDALPEDFPMDFVFSSGVGAWATSMTLEQDGAFSGAYYDADMGVCDEDYPNGTVYICDFSGRFSDIQKVDEYSYSLTLAELDSDYEAGKEWIENGTKNISSHFAAEYEKKPEKKLFPPSRMAWRTGTNLSYICRTRR